MKIYIIYVEFKIIAILQIINTIKTTEDKLGSKQMQMPQ